MCRIPDKTYTALHPPINRLSLEKLPALDRLSLLDGVDELFIKLRCLEDFQDFFERGCRVPSRLRDLTLIAIADNKHAVVQTVVTTGVKHKALRIFQIRRARPRLNIYAGCVFVNVFRIKEEPKCAAIRGNGLCGVKNGFSDNGLGKKGGISYDCAVDKPDGFFLTWIPSAPMIKSA